MDARRVLSVLLGAGLVLSCGTSGAQGPDEALRQRVLILEGAMAELQDTAARAVVALEANASLRQQLATAKEMAATALNGQSEVRRKAQAIVDRASGGRVEIDELKARLESLESSVAAQGAALAAIDRQPAPIPVQAPVQTVAPSGRERIVYLGDARTLNDAAPVASEIGPCPALQAGSADAWQAALNSYGSGLIFVSVDLDAQLALIKTAQGNREAIAATDVLSRSGCL